MAQAVAAVQPANVTADTGTEGGPKTQSPNGESMKRYSRCCAVGWVDICTDRVRSWVDSGHPCRVLNTAALDPDRTLTVLARRPASCNMTAHTLLMIRVTA